MSGKLEKNTFRIIIACMLILAVSAVFTIPLAGSVSSNSFKKPSKQSFPTLALSNSTRPANIAYLAKHLIPFSSTEDLFVAKDTHYLQSVASTPYMTAPFGTAVAVDKNNNIQTAFGYEDFNKKEIVLEVREESNNWKREVLVAKKSAANNPQAGRYLQLFTLPKIVRDSKGKTHIFAGYLNQIMDRQSFVIKSEYEVVGCAKDESKKIWVCNTIHSQTIPSINSFTNGLHAVTKPELFDAIITSKGEARIAYAYETTRKKTVSTMGEHDIGFLRAELKNGIWVKKILVTNPSTVETEDSVISELAISPGDDGNIAYISSDKVNLSALKWVISRHEAQKLDVSASFMRELDINVLDIGGNKKIPIVTYLYDGRSIRAADPSKKLLPSPLLFFHANGLVIDRASVNNKFDIATVILPLKGYKDPKLLVHSEFVGAGDCGYHNCRLVSVIPAIHVLERTRFLGPSFDLSTRIQKIHLADVP